MNIEQDIDWEAFDNFMTKDFSHTFPNFDQDTPFFTSYIKDQEIQEVNMPEENISTSISDIELDQKIIRPKMARMTCPECWSKIKAFQYNKDMSVFMCENIKVT